MSGYENNRGGSSIIEDPGIPLVGATQGRFADYAGTDNNNLVTTSSNATGINLSMNETNSDMSFQRQDSRDVATGKAFREGLGGSGWNLVTTGGGPLAGKCDSISYRLSRRKNLIQRRRILVDVACALAMLGIILMLLETELFLQGYIEKDDAVSFLLRLGVTISTVMLLIAITGYHVSGVQLSMVDNGIEDWRVVTRPKFFCYVLLELLVCAIHPPPGDLAVQSMYTVESVLCVLMFLRLYLVARVFVVHSHLATDTATLSLGAMNKVRIDTMFVFKALMSERPGGVLILMMTVIFFLSSWSVRACDAYMAIASNLTSEAVPGQILSEAMWMSAITFLTVGYGDVTPKSECGRVTAVATGLLGVGSTALLVAVLAHKLEQSRAEKYVHAFVSRVAFDKSHKNAAADVIKNVLKLWRLRRQSSPKLSIRVRAHGKLLQAVREMRDAKAAKANIGESAVGIIEVNTAVDSVFRATEAITDQQKSISQRTDQIEARLEGIEEKLDRIASAVMR